MLLNISDYQHIFETAHAMLNAEGANTTKSCVFYNYCGAYILNHHYGLNAKAYSGFAAYHLGVEQILGFGTIVDGELVSSEDAFHTWIEVDGWLIDFMAPEFPIVMSNFGVQTPIPRKMMQREIAQMTYNPDEMIAAGDFMVFPDVKVSNAIINHIESKSAVVDLIDIL